MGNFVFKGFRAGDEDELLSLLALFIAQLANDGDARAARFCAENLYYFSLSD